MADNGTSSLLEAARSRMASQGQLFPAPVDGAAVLLPPAVSDESRDCTAARLFTHRPEDYARAVFWLAEGVPVSRIAAVLRVSPNTIYSIRRRESGEVERRKEEIADQFEDLAHASAEAAAERLADPEARAKIPYQQLVIGGAVSVDKFQLLRGGATARIEIARDDASELERLTLEAESVDVTDLGGGARGQIERGRPAGSGAGVGVAGLLGGGLGVDDDQAPQARDGGEGDGIDSLSGVSGANSLACKGGADGVSDSVSVHGGAEGDRLAVDGRPDEDGARGPAGDAGAVGQGEGGVANRGGDA